MISAEVIADSISPEGKRLTTFKLRYPKFIHGEFMTHRVISRNASSSRAVPTARLIEEVRSDALRAAPVFWGKNQKGMQATEELSSATHGPFYERNDVSELTYAKEIWGQAAYHASRYAELLSEHGVHKQIVNRLLEPFSHINVVASATEWSNFFGLRLHKDAQPEMRFLAREMWFAQDTSRPRKLSPGEWHLPFVAEIEPMSDIKRNPRCTCPLPYRAIVPEVHEESCPVVQQGLTPQEQMIRISVARCARVSYESFETGKRSTVEEDLKLYSRLVGAQPLHASPAEHQATPDTSSDKLDSWRHLHEHGNFVGWRQHRKMLRGEAVAPLPAEFAAE